MAWELRTIFAAMTAAMASTAATAAPSSVEIRDAVVRIVVLPEARSDVSVEVLAHNPALPLKVYTSGARTVVDGGLSFGRIANCRSENGHASVDVRGVGQVRYEDMPQIVVHMPRDADVAVSGAAIGSIGRSQSLSFANAGCGTWTLANVSGPLTLSLSGSGDVKGGSAQHATIRVAGSGDISLQRLTQGAQIDISGSGSTRIAALDGPLDVNVAGSGDVTIAQGQAESVDINLAGSGDMRFGGTAKRLDVKLVGSGDVQVHQVTGVVQKSIVGSGDVKIGP